MRLQQGQPVRPYAQHEYNAGETVRIDITALDFDDEIEAPTTLTYRIDNLTDAVNVVPTTNIPTPGTTSVLTIAASVNAMYTNWRDQQLMQVVFTATWSDGSQVPKIGLYQLNRIYQAPFV